KSCYVARPSTPRFLKAGEITSASDSGIPTFEHPLSERPSDKVLQRTESAATGKISPRRREEILCDSSRLRVFVANRMPVLPGERREILSSLWCCSEDERGFEVERHENHRSVVAVCGRRGRYCAEQAAGASVAHQG